MNEVDFSRVTACGECCDGCGKKRDGRCPGCIEADGYVPEWAESGRCKVHACARAHGALFCGACLAFPCPGFREMIFWKKDALERHTKLRETYFAAQNGKN